jgi:hypothetical protein
MVIIPWYDMAEVHRKVNCAEQVHSICGVLHFAINRTEISSGIRTKFRLSEISTRLKTNIESHKHLYLIVLCISPSGGVHCDYLDSLTTPETGPH